MIVGGRDELRREAAVERDIGHQADDADQRLRNESGDERQKYGPTTENDDALVDESALGRRSMRSCLIHSLFFARFSTCPSLNSIIGTAPSSSPRSSIM